MILNSDLIEHIEMTPDTVIALTSGQKYMVLETTDEIIERVVSFRQSLIRNQPAQSTSVSARIRPRKHCMGEPPSMAETNANQAEDEAKPKLRSARPILPVFLDWWWRSRASWAD
jgi:uncharacterized protein YlzI (FlbEa/FlbD family)